MGRRNSNPLGAGRRHPTVRTPPELGVLSDPCNISFQRLYELVHARLTWSWRIESDPLKLPQRFRNRLRAHRSPDNSSEALIKGSRLVPRCSIYRMSSRLPRRARESGHPGHNARKAALGSRLRRSDDNE
jgi:hypothetical protein